MESKTIRVGICDDHPVFRAGVRALIADNPDLILLVETATLAQLRDEISATPIDLLLLDVSLPDGSGLDEVAECVRWARVLMLSATANARAIRRALGDGATGFVRKDAPADELLRSIRRAAAGHRVLASDLMLSVANTARGESGDAAFHRRVAALTPRQRDVLRLLSEGKSNREIADALHLTEGTVKNHVSQILEALVVPDRTRLALLIARHGIDP